MPNGSGRGNSTSRRVRRAATTMMRSRGSTAFVRASGVSAPSPRKELQVTTTASAAFADMASDAIARSSVENGPLARLVEWSAGVSRGACHGCQRCASAGRPGHDRCRCPRAGRHVRADKQPRVIHRQKFGSFQNSPLKLVRSAGVPSDWWHRLIPGYQIISRSGQCHAPFPESIVRRTL